MKTGRFTAILAFAVASPLLGANLEVSPTSHDFGNVPLGQRKTTTIRVSNEGVLSRTVPVRSSSPHVTVTDASLSIPGKKFVNLIVVLGEKAPAGALAATITIGDGKDAVRVGVRANVQAPAAPKPTAAVPAPAITVNPASLDFGSVELNQPKTLTFTVSSPEAVSCTVGTSNFSFFSGSPASLSLPANQPATVTVTFTAKVTLQNTGSTTAKTTVTCGASKATVELKGATPVPKRFKLTVDGAGLVGEIQGKAPSDPQSTFGQVIGCNLQEDLSRRGTCANTVQAGAQVEMKAICDRQAPKFRWSTATGSAASCLNSTNLVCTFVIAADTSLVASCSK